MNKKLQKSVKKLWYHLKSANIISFLKVRYAKITDPTTLNIRFHIEKYLDSLPKNDGPCQVIRKNCRDQKVKYQKNIFKKVLRLICIFLTSKIV